MSVNLQISCPGFGQKNLKTCYLLFSRFEIKIEHPLRFVLLFVNDSFEPFYRSHKSETYVDFHSVLACLVQFFINFLSYLDPKNKTSKNLVHNNVHRRDSFS